MSQSSIGPFIPLFDPLVQRYGLVTASVYGLVWRYCQMKDGICRASQTTLAARLSISRTSLIRQLDQLKDEGLIQDRTPDLRNRPHILAVTPKIFTLSQEAASLASQRGPSTVPNLDTSPGPGVPQLDSHDPNNEQHCTTAGHPTVPNWDMSQTLLIDHESDEGREGLSQPKNGNLYSAEDLWDYIYAELAPQLSRVDLHTWVQPSRPLSWDGATLVMAVHNYFARDWLTAHARPIAQRTLQAYLGAPSACLQFIVCE